jgi:hypothetical protein
MKTRLALAAVTVVMLGAFAVSAIPAYSHRGDPAKPGLCFIDENKDGICDHAPAGMTTMKGQEGDKAYAGRDCPRRGEKGAGWGMMGGKMCPNLRTVIARRVV